MAFIKTLLCYGLYERGSMEQHPLIALVVVLLCHLSPPVAVPLPQFCVPDFLYFVNSVAGKEAPSVPLVPGLPDGALHLLLHCTPLRIIIPNIHQDCALARARGRRMPDSRGIP